MLNFNDDLELKYGVYGVKNQFLLDASILFGSYIACLSGSSPTYLNIIIPILACLSVNKSISISREKVLNNNKDIIALKDTYESIINEIVNIGQTMGLSNPIDYYVLTEYLYNNGFLVNSDRLRKFNVDGYGHLSKYFKKEVTINNVGSGMERNLLLTNILVNAGFKASYDAGIYRFNDLEDKNSLIEYLAKNDYFDKENLNCVLNYDSVPAFKSLKKMDINGKSVDFDLMFFNGLGKKYVNMPNYILTKVLIDDFLVYLDLYKDRYFRHVVGNKYISNEANEFIKDKSESSNIRKEYQVKDYKSTPNIDLETMEEYLKLAEEKIQDNLKLVDYKGEYIRSLVLENTSIYRKIESKLLNNL